MKIPWKLSLLQAKKLSFKKTIETQGLLLVFLHLKESSGAFSHANGDYWSNYSVMKIKVRFEKKVSHASSSTKYKMEFLQWSQIFHIFFLKKASVRCKRWSCMSHFFDVTKRHCVWKWQNMSHLNISRQK